MTLGSWTWMFAAAFWATSDHTLAHRGPLSARLAAVATLATLTSLPIWTALVLWAAL